MKFLTIILFLITFFNTGTEEELRELFSNKKREGTIILFSSEQNKAYISNKEISEKPLIPASTFKILNSLIALETGVIKDENEIIKWDNVDRGNPNWNKDTDMKNAFKNSTVWFYQEMARRIGKERMQDWVNKTDYGNKNINPNIDDFWLKGDLRITPMQQINFLQKLYDDKLPFSKINMDKVKSMMFRDSFDKTKIYGKTGWGQHEGETGWFIGYAIKDNSPWFFATCIIAEKEDDDFPMDSIRITYEALRLFQVIEG